MQTSACDARPEEEATMMKLGIAALALSAASFAAVGPADASDVAPEGQQWGSHGNITQAAADAAGSYAAAGRLQAQQNFSLAEWTSLPETYLTSNLQALFGHPGPARFYTEEQLEQLRMLATQRGVVLFALTPAVSSGPEPRAT
jgi:acyl-coenzyme A thioesterase PaaI-like protein